MSYHDKQLSLSLFIHIYIYTYIYKYIYIYIHIYIYLCICTWFALSSLYLCFTSFSCPIWWYTWDLDSSYTVSDTIDVSNYITFFDHIMCIYALVTEYFLNPSWYHPSFDTKKSGSVFFVDRQNLLQDMPPSFAFLGVRRRWILTRENWSDLKMAISKVAFSNAWMILWWELMMILILVFQEIIFLMSCYFLWLFPNVFWPWWRNHMSLLMSLLISFLGFMM